MFYNMFMDWLLLMSLGPFSLIVIPGMTLTFSVIILGYCIGIIKNTLKGIDTLPDWNSEIVKDGILYTCALFILSLVVHLPAILLLIIGLFDIPGDPIDCYSGKFPIDGVFYISITSILNLVVYLPVTLLLTVGLSSTLEGLTGYLVYLIPFNMLLALIVLLIYVPLATVNFAKKGFFGFFKFSDVLKKISLEYIGILLCTLLGVVTAIISVIITFEISAPLLYLAFPSGVLFLLFSTLVIGILDFILWVMSFRAVVKYYLEREKEINK